MNVQMADQSKAYKNEQSKKYIDEFLKTHKIAITKELGVAFENHIDVLLSRLSNNECAELADMSMMEQISDSYIELARTMLEPLFTEYGVKPSKAEIILIAIYFQTSKEG